MYIGHLRKSVSEKQFRQKNRLQILPMKWKILKEKFLHFAL